MTEFVAPSVEIVVYGRYAVEFVYIPPRRRTVYDVSITCPFVPTVDRASYVNDVTGDPPVFTMKNPSARSAFRCWLESPIIEMIEPTGIFVLEIVTVMILGVAPFETTFVTLISVPGIS
jgi:hypothetical protein